MEVQACILLMRHGKKKSVGTDLSIKDEQLDLSNIGWEMTKEAGLALAEEARKGAGGAQFQVSRIWHSRACHAKTTAELLCDILVNQGVAPTGLPPKEDSDLNLDKIWGADRKSQTKKIVKNLLDQFGASPSNGIQATLVVGHEPQLGWLASELLNGDVPLAHSEIACISVNLARKSSRRSKKLLWVISPSEPAQGWNADFKGWTAAEIKPNNTDSAGKIVADLKEKIKSKMDTAKLLGGIITAAVGWISSSFLDHEKFAKLACWAQYEVLASIVLLLSSLVLFMRTMYSYDSLLMPSRFWSSGHASNKNLPRWLVARPPSPASWVLYQNMMHIWNWQFTPAVCAAALGIATLAMATLTNSGTLSLRDWGFGAILVLSVITIVVCSKWGGAKLGVQD